MSQATSSPSGPEMAVIRKLVYDLAELDGELEREYTDVPLMEAAKMAVENVETLRSDLETTRAQLEQMKDRVPEPSRKAYDDMDKHDKVTVLRQKLKDQAENTNGTAYVQYKDVVRMFDGHPSPGHAYDLMETAAQAEGYNYGTNPEGEKRLTYTVND